MKGDWSPVRAPGRGRGLFTVAAQALPGHLPLPQAPAIRPSAVTALASVGPGGRGPVLGQRVPWRGWVPRCCPGAWLPSPAGGRTSLLLRNRIFFFPQMFPLLRAQAIKNIWFSASQSPRSQSWALSRSPSPCTPRPAAVATTNWNLTARLRKASQLVRGMPRSLF